MDEITRPAPLPGFCFLRKFANFVVGIQVAGVTAIFGRFGRVSPLDHIICHSVKENALNAKFAENNMEIVYRELARLVPNPKNPRTATKEAIEKLAESIRENPKFFEARPILLSDRTGELVIIGGERRSQAAMLLNMDKVPTILLQGLTEAEEDEIMVRDNTHSGEWDNAKIKALADQWGKDKITQWGGVKMIG